MIDPLLSLALSMQSNPGLYALLLGSGVSRAAGVPTGWEVVLDLIARLAAMEGEEPGPDPEAWYREKYGHAPTYSGLLEVVGRSQAERSQLLKSYFEPTDDDREEGQGVPTAAHRAIADLVKSRIVRVLITTNFDRLLEQALRAEGVEPTVVASPSEVAGMIPLAHVDCVIIKLHGDYLDLRTRNTPSELEAYEPQIDALLDRVFDEYGLIICGWSAEWDTALRSAIARATARRYSTFWTTLSEPNDKSKDLINLRQAQVITIESADTFLDTLAEKVHVLNELQSPHPLSVQAAVAQTKRYLVQDKERIRLSDLVMNEVERVIEETDDEHFPTSTAFNAAVAADRMARFENIAATICAIVSTGAYWGSKEQSKNWVDAVDRLTNRGDHPPRPSMFQGIQYYPALLAQYAASIAAVANGRYDIAFETMTRPQLERRDAYKYLPSDLYKAIDHNLFEVVTGKNLYGVRSQYLRDVLWPVVRETVRSERAYYRAFDVYETLQSLEAVHRSGWVIPSMFVCKYYTIRDGKRIGLQNDEAPLVQFEEEVLREGGSASILKAGFLGGSPHNLNAASAKIDEVVARRF